MKHGVCVAVKLGHLSANTIIQNLCKSNLYFSLNSDYCPIHLALLDEVVSNHPLLHNSVLELYMELFEGSYGEMEILAILEIKKMLVDRLVNLLSRGCVLPVVKYMVKCWQNTDTDISLIRCCIVSRAVMVNEDSHFFTIST